MQIYIYRQIIKINNDMWKDMNYINELYIDENTLIRAKFVARNLSLEILGENPFDSRII